MSTRTATDAPAMPRAALSWSAGKDGCLAWLRVREQGIDVSTFVTMCEGEGDGGGPSLSHALPRAWLARQVAACAVAWRAVDVHRGSPGAYAEVFGRTLADLRRDGHTHMVFGDIDLAAHRNWIAPRCEAAGLVPLFPLWGEGRAALAREVIARGIQARLVAVDTASLDAAFCGAAYDAALLARLPAAVCPCGEDGEFHTAVTFAPGMAHAVPLPAHRVQVVASAPPLAPTRIARLVFD
jgi:diphthine-ammonia ligase